MTFEEWFAKRNKTWSTAHDRYLAMDAWNAATEEAAKVADSQYGCDNPDCRGCVGCATGKAIRGLPAGV